MADPNEQIHVTATEARGGATPGMTRYILAASLVLVIVAFVIVYLVG
jgi:hypothetical protein